MDGESPKPSITTPRLPDVNHKGHNGFFDSVAQTLHGKAKNARELNPGASKLDIEHIEDRMLRDTMERHRFVGDFMEIRGSYFPNLEEMKEANDAPETASALLAEIKGMRQRHRDDVSTLYDWQTQDYLAEAMDQYASKDDAITLAEVERFYQTLHRPDIPSQSAYNSQLEALRYGHVKTLIPFVRHYNEVLSKEQEAKRRRDNHFPKNLDEFRKLPNKDLQYKIAKFLTLDVLAQDKLLQKYGWTWPKLKALDDQWNTNPQFKIEIQTVVQEWESHNPTTARP